MTHWKTRATQARRDLARFDALPQDVKMRLVDAVGDRLMDESIEVQRRLLACETEEN